MVGSKERRRNVVVVGVVVPVLRKPFDVQESLEVLGEPEVTPAGQAGKHTNGRREQGQGLKIQAHSAVGGSLASNSKWRYIRRLPRDSRGWVAG